MRKSTAKPTTVDEYLAAVPADKRRALQRLRKDIHAAAPGAEECISYGMPGFRVNGRVAVWLGAAERHCSFYPGGVVDAHKADLKGYDVSKGTVRFQAGDPLPAALVRKLVRSAVAREGR